jgi:hypothetical protein
MKLNKALKVEKLFSKGRDSRFATHAALLEGENLIATNGRALVKLPIERQEGDTDGLISKEAIVASRKGNQTIQANGSLVAAGITFPRETSSDYPKWRNVVPEPSKMENKVAVAVNIRLLWEMAQALGCEALTLEFDSSGTRPILATPCGEKNNAPEGAIGVIMPLCKLK